MVGGISCPGRTTKNPEHLSMPGFVRNEKFILRSVELLNKSKEFVQVFLLRQHRFLQRDVPYF